MTLPRHGSGGRAFEACVFSVCDRFLSQRTFDLIVAPSLADLDFEAAAGRRSPWSSRAAVIRAVTGAVQQDMRGGTADFLKLSLLSFCYFIFPIALGIGIFETWSEFAVAATLVLVMSLVPVMVCFWPARGTVRPE